MRGGGQLTSPGELSKAGVCNMDLPCVPLALAVPRSPVVRAEMRPFASRVRGGITVT